MQKLVLLLLVTSVFCMTNPGPPVCQAYDGIYDAHLEIDTKMITAGHTCNTKYHMPQFKAECSKNYDKILFEGEVSSCETTKDKECDSMCDIKNQKLIGSTSQVTLNITFGDVTEVTQAEGKFSYIDGNQTRYSWDLKKVETSKECSSVDKRASNYWCNANCHDSAGKLASACDNASDSKDQICACDDDKEPVKEEFVAGWAWCHSIDTRASTSWCNQNCHDGAGQLHPACNPNSPKQDQTCSCPANPPAPQGRCYSIDKRASSSWCNINCHDGADQLHPACNPNSPRQDQTCRCRW